LTSPGADTRLALVSLVFAATTTTTTRMAGLVACAVI
jgi:hypothetical protein